MTSIKGMSVEELDAATAELKMRKQAADRCNRSTEDLAAIEKCSVAVMNELRRRGL